MEVPTLCVSVQMTVKFIRPADVLPAKHLEGKEVFPYGVPMDALLEALSENNHLAFLFGCHLMGALSKLSGGMNCGGGSCFLCSAACDKLRTCSVLAPSHSRQKLPGKPDQGPGHRLSALMAQNSCSVLG